MDRSKSENKKGVISCMWRRCKSFSDIIGKNKRSTKVAPVGYFLIYVGPEKDRFVIKAKQVNHPLFKNLLEQAESVYGYDNKGPLVLPCQVDYFVQVLMEMDYSCGEEIGEERGCSFVARSRHSSYHFLTPPIVIALVDR